MSPLVRLYLGKSRGPFVAGKKK